jgi:hypothetical protein
MLRLLRLLRGLIEVAPERVDVGRTFVSFSSLNLMISPEGSR